MGDHQHGRAGLRHQLHEQLQHRVAGGLVEVARGLIGEDQVGLPCQGPGDGHALLLPARQLLRVAGCQG
jgi:hypothetical protein